MINIFLVFFIKKYFMTPHFKQLFNRFNKAVLKNGHKYVLYYGNYKQVSSQTFRNSCLLGALKVYGYTFMFSINFTKGNNCRDFLFASLTDIALPNWGFL